LKIAVIGTGYVGLVTSTCLAESGNQVVGIDKDAGKIAILEQGSLPIYEPGLLELVQRNRREGRLTFTTDLAVAVAGSEVSFIAVGTPQRDDGDADLSAIWHVGEAIASTIRGYHLVVLKSTVPVGTNRQLHKQMAARTTVPFDVANNPEFLKEGTALDDFMKPDRVVVGVRRAEAAGILRDLYAPFLRTENPFLVMSPESAEMTKYVANAMLAAKISFINEMANLCERTQADINDVRRGIGHDQRIGFPFLFPGAGWGGSCFPKDIQALIALARRSGVPLQLMESVQSVNDQQKRLLAAKIRAHYGESLPGRTLAMWGLSFKPRTDDIREAPALVVIDELLQSGVKLQVHDPVAMDNVRKIYQNRLVYCDKPYDALVGADGLVIVTEWQEFRHPDFDQMKALLQQPTIFDGRNLYEPKLMREKGFTYHGIGRFAGD
jgi:UDPglucose 6-dehydrogenase